MQAILLYFRDFVTKYYWMFLYILVIIAKIQNHEKHANIKAFSWFVKDFIIAFYNKNNHNIIHFILFFKQNFLFPRRSCSTFFIEHDFKISIFDMLNDNCPTQSSNFCKLENSPWICKTIKYFLSFWRCSMCFLFYKLFPVLIVFWTAFATATIVLNIFYIFLC